MNPDTNAAVTDTILRTPKLYKGGKTSQPER